MAENPAVLDLQDSTASPTESFAHNSTASPTESFAQNGDSLTPTISPVEQAPLIDEVGTMDVLSTSGVLASLSLGVNGTRADSSSEASTVQAGAVAICRICHEEDELRNLDTPCACSGTIKYVHGYCLLDWVMVKRDYVCEICQQPYKKGYEAPLPFRVSLQAAEDRLTNANRMPPRRRHISPSRSLSMGQDVSSVALTNANRMSPRRRHISPSRSLSMGQDVSSVARRSVALLDVEGQESRVITNWRGEARFHQ